MDNMRTLNADDIVSETAKLSFAVENLTDFYYVEPLSLTRIRSLGRTLRIGFTTDFHHLRSGWVDLDNANAQDCNFGNADTTIAEVHLGYDYQFANNLVVGIGDEYSFTNLRKGVFETRS